MLSVFLLTSACSSASNINIIKKFEVSFEKLNPARGDQSPLAGTIWGDRSKKGATGFIFKPTDGFSSPPHIHNVSYRGVVISGLIHNDDENAESQWMSTGSFWTQPKGDVHITSAKGNNTLAYIEIDEGPYLVMPPKDHFHTDEVSVNIDKSNIVWLDSKSLKWIDNGNSEVAFLWGKQKQGEMRGNLVNLPAGFRGSIVTKAKEFRAVVINGDISHDYKNSSDVRYFDSKGDGKHNISCSSNSDCMLYIRTNDMFKL